MASGDSPSGSLRLLGATSLAHFVNDGTSFFVPVIAALLTQLRGFSPIQATVLFVVFYATSSILGLAVGWWADRSGRPAFLMAFGIGLLALGLFLFAIVVAGWAGPAEYPVALLAGGVTGFATSFYHPLGASLLQRAFSPAQQGTVLGINGAFGSLGRALYPFLWFLATLVIVETTSLLPFVAFGAIAMIVVAWATQSITARERARPSVPSGTAATSLTSGIVALTGVAFVRSIATQGVAAWIPIYLTNVQGVSTGDLGLVVTIMYVGGILGQPFFGLAANRLDRRLLMGVSSAGAALATLAYLNTSGPEAEAFLFVIGFFTFSAFPLLMTLSSDYVPNRSSSLANALVFGLGSGGGGTIGPLVVGAIAAGGYALLPTGFEVMVVLGLIAAVLVVLLPRGSRGRRGALFG